MPRDPLAVAAMRRYRLVKAVNACPHRTPVGSCGCDGWCALGLGSPVPANGGGPDRSLVTLDGCAACPELPRA